VHVGVSLVSDMSARVPARHQAVSSPSADRFDAIVISGKVGVHKPEPKVFTLVVQLLAVMAPETVLVDDLATTSGCPRPEPGRGHHRSYDDTAAELVPLFDLRLRD
jgi:hypothetical protein